MEKSNKVERIRYRFIGHVQQRGFRFACVSCARKEGMTGWVRNERNGTVTAEVQGSPTSQLSFVRKLSSLVSGFGNTWSIGTERRIDPVENEGDFGVRRY